MHPFTLSRPADISAAITAHAHDAHLAFIAGGTDLIGLMKDRVEARRFAGDRNGVHIPRENQPIVEGCTRKSGTSCLTPRPDPLTKPNVSHLRCLRESGFLESVPTGRQSRPLHESGLGI